MSLVARMRSPSEERNTPHGRRVLLRDEFGPVPDTYPKFTDDDWILTRMDAPDWVPSGHTHCARCGELVAR